MKDLPISKLVAISYLDQKRLPGVDGWTDMVYNRLDQLVFSQDVVQRGLSSPQRGFTKYDFAAVKSILNNIEVKETDVDKLLSVLLKTKNILVANMIAFCLKKFKDSRILDALIKVISRPENFNKRAKLIYSCDQYDCTRYFELFMEIVLEESGESCINAVDIISEMKGPFLNNQLSNAVSKLEAYIDVNKNNDNVPYLKELKKHLKRVICFLRESIRTDAGGG